MARTRGAGGALDPEWQRLRVRQQSRPLYPPRLRRRHAARAHPGRRFARSGVPPRVALPVTISLALVACRRGAVAQRAVPTHIAARCTKSGVKLLTLGQHLDEFLETSSPRLGSLRRLQSVEYRVAVRRAQRVEELLRLRRSCERLREIVRNLRVGGRVVCGGPASIGLRALDLGEAGG